VLKALYLLSPRWLRLIYPESIDAELCAHVQFAGPAQSAESIRDNLNLLSDVDVVFTGWGMAPLDRELLEHAPHLRAIFHAAGTVRYFMTPEAWARELIVCTANAINAIPVAEYTLAAILFGLRRGWHYAAAVRAQRNLWYAKDLPGSYDSTVAVISLGAVGRLVCERLRSFDVRVVACDPFCSEEQATELGVELVSLGEAFGRGDIVSPHAPLLPETTGMIRREHFSAMKHGATFINTARGALVRENEMIDGLRERPDLHAVLDVTETEPPAQDSPLYELANVVLTPHIAGTCEREAARLGRAMVDDFHRWRKGEPLRHQISETQAARLA